MRIVIAGSSGTIGTALRGVLEGRGDEVARLVRPSTEADGIEWDPSRDTIDASGLEGVDVVINLAGRSIGERRWTDAEKRLVWDSRVESTRLLAETIARLERPPRQMVNASAVGYYGDGGDEILSEASSPGSGFLSDLCVAWEAATAPAADAGVGVSRLRTGIVLTADGGALGRMLAPLGPRWLSPYRWGLGGPVAGGHQWWSWISLNDAIEAIVHAIDTQLVGPVNLVSPEPVTNRVFTKTLGTVLRRPTVIPIPGFAVRILLGSELAEALVLQGQRVEPAALEQSGFAFTDPDLEEALREALA